MSINVYSFAYLAESYRRPDFVDSAQLHPRMETPPVWQPLADEIAAREVPVEYPEGEWIWWAAAVALGVLASAAWPYWITS